MLLIIEFLSGAVAGIALGRWVRSYSFGWVINALVGGIGGLILEWPTTRVLGLGRFIGPVGNVVGLTPAILIGSIVVGLLGGLILVLLAGLQERSYEPEIDTGKAKVTRCRAMSIGSSLSFWS
ncbi:hypothetical protein SAZ10_17280 [Mesorhizobium sp. BAC0120]|uniref:hypothetical protein n=1 Tax=Mesorhizobium sp. BAC0120 TaxID=3090670 RepID=UPI00298D084C|nr:hypothetical protein [Mesorhizobium sp. BAC0120]MDW6023505.1 hypothetical protein [Mesorhizobium sp. BAC0120]